MTSHAAPRGGVDDALARHARHAAAVELRRGELTAARDEEIRHGAADRVAVLVQHYALRDFGVGPFGAREDVLQPVQVLYAGRGGLAREPQAAQTNAYAVRRVALRVVGKW